MGLQLAGKMPEGSYVKLPGEWVVYFVRYVTMSGVHLIPLNGIPGLIKTRKGKTKNILRHKNTVVVSSGTIVQEVDPAQLDLAKVRRRLDFMARKETEGTVAEGQETAVAEAPKPKPERKNQKYLRTSKESKEMRGQGKIVLDALDALKEPKTVAELTTICKGKFQTRQDDERIVGFYLSKFKREGLVSVVKEEEAAAASSESATDEHVSQ